MGSIVDRIHSDIEDGTILDPFAKQNPQDWRLRYSVNGRPFEMYLDAKIYAETIANRLQRNINIYEYVKTIQPTKK